MTAAVLKVGSSNQPTTFLSTLIVNTDMTQSRLLEIARLRSLIGRMVKAWGTEATLDMLRLVIESELLKEPAE